MKKLKIGIYGVAIFMFICLLTNGFNVYAKSKCSTRDEYVNNINKNCTVAKMKNRYKLKITRNSAYNYTIKLVGKSGSNNDDKFKITSVVKGTLKDSSLPSKKMTKGDSVTINIDPTNDNGLDVVEVEAKLVESSTFGYCFYKSSCNKDWKVIPNTDNEAQYVISASISFGASLESQPAVSADTVNIRNQELQALISKINNATPIPSSFDLGEFEKIKNKANTQGNNTPYKKVNGKKQASKELKCNYSTKQVANNTTYYSKNEYYSNVDYFYKKAKVDSNNGEEDTTYPINYNYYPGKTVTKTFNLSDLCTTTCEEAVKVEYGPPVASMAGLCFEYSVKVTSYVKCDAKVNEAKIPELNPTYCTPAPECEHNNQILRQAGPSDEYDSCIKQCDGGKYSRKCSDKCYKKIYGDSGIVGMNGYFMADIQKMNSSNKCADTDGCYYRSGDSILWTGSKIGRWYRLSGYDTHYYGNESYFNDKGFLRADYGGSECNDECTWVGCSDKNQYLNPQQARADAQENYKTIKNALDSCSAAAKCSTSQSSYTIKIDTKTFNTSTTSNDTTKCESKSSQSKEFVQFEKENSTSSEGKFNGQKIVTDNDGCYKKGTGINDMYMTEWSTPDSWLDVKHGSVQYTKPGKNITGYVKKDKNYCLPLNIASVNKKWWNAYVNAANGGSISAAPDTWNITASAKKFGYFGWYFDISCFYAINNNSLNASGNKSSKNECNNDGGGSSNNTNTSTLIDNYSFRVVDKSSGSSLFANRSSEKNEIGYNWTNNATASKLGDGYETSPTKVIENITSGNDKNLDYEFNLSKKTLSEIKKYTSDTKKNDYTNFESGSVESNDTLSYFVSKLVTQLNGRKNGVLGKNNNYK